MWGFFLFLSLAIKEIEYTSLIHILFKIHCLIVLVRRLEMVEDFKGRVHGRPNFRSQFSICYSIYYWQFEVDFFFKKGYLLSETRFVK